MVTKSYTFQESVNYLLSLGNEVSAMKLGLENIRTLLAASGHPEKNYLKVQVAGTNGKGSVCAFLEAICLSAGIKTGLNTSPHLLSITERIRINGKEISEADFTKYATSVRETAEDLFTNREVEYRPTFFEQITAVSLIAFSEARVDLTILETGLGGRLDATTAAGAEMAAITRIDYDHQEYLGETLTEIAVEKAAIIHKGSKVVIGEQQPEVMTVLNSVCANLGVSPQFAQDVVTSGSATVKERAACDFITPGRVYENVCLGLFGSHQIENAKVAILLAEILQNHFPIATGHVVKGLERARHPGRLEFTGNVLIDGAHNVGGAEALAKFIDENIDTPIILIFGSMSDKNVEAMGKILFPRVESLILTKPVNSRAMEPNEIRKYVPANIAADRVIVVEDVEIALAEARKMAEKSKLILVAGSLYLVGEVKAMLRQ
jgi:dihydrofolate synthase/folylpolyglutamate synthase